MTTDLPYHHQHYVFEGIDYQVAERQAFDQARNGNRVRVHYHHYAQPCNDRCHDVVVPRG